MIDTASAGCSTPQGGAPALAEAGTIMVATSDQAEKMEYRVVMMNVCSHECCSASVTHFS
eukprot:COSAG01_NODE_11466_length_1928_cov_3.286495_2_plen_60_part_00